MRVRCRSRQAVDWRLNEMERNKHDAFCIRLVTNASISMLPDESTLLGADHYGYQLLQHLQH